MNYCYKVTIGYSATKEGGRIAMQVVKAIFDGKNIQPIDPVHLKNNTEVLVIFPSDTQVYPPEIARKRLRGSGKGEGLTKKLLKSRREDIKLE